MLKSVLKLTKPAARLTQSAAMCNYIRCYFVVIPKETACEINQSMVRYFAKKTDTKQLKRESKKKEKSLKSEEIVNEPITKSSDIAKKDGADVQEKTKLSKKEEYERAVAAKKEMKEKLKSKSEENTNELNKGKGMNEEKEEKEATTVIDNFGNEKEFISDPNSFSSKIVEANSLKSAIKILEEHQHEFKLNEIPYIIKTFGVYFSSEQSKEGIKDIEEIDEYKTFVNFLNNYYEKYFQSNDSGEYPMSPTQIVDVLITLFRLHLARHPLNILLTNKINSLVSSLSLSHLSKLLWLCVSNNVCHYHQVYPIVNSLKDNFNQLNEENLCRAVWSIASFPYRFGFSDVLNKGLECLIELNQTKQIDLKRLIKMLENIPPRNTNSCKYINVLFKMLISYSSQFTYSEAVIILHSYVVHWNDLAFSNLSEEMDILQTPTPELENILKQSLIIASEHINDLDKQELIQLAFYLNHRRIKDSIPDYVMINLVKRISEYIDTYSPSKSITALDLFSKNTKGFIMDYFDIYKTILEHVKSQLRQMNEAQLNVVIIIFRRLHLMLGEDDEVIPYLMPVISEIITVKNPTDLDKTYYEGYFSTRIIGTYLRCTRQMNLAKPPVEEMNNLLTQFIKGMSLDKTAGDDIMMVLSFAYVENRELVVKILDFIDNKHECYTLSTLTAVSLLRCCVKFDFYSRNIYKLCLACFLSDPEAVQLEEFTAFCRYSLKMKIISNTFKKLLPILENCVSKFKATSLVDILTYISTMNISYPTVFQKAKEIIIRDKRSIQRANVDEETFKEIYYHFFNSIKPEELSENDRYFYEKVLCEVYK